MDKVAQNGFSSGEDFSSKMFVLGSEYLLSMAACKRYKRQNGINKKQETQKTRKARMKTKCEMIRLEERNKKKEINYENWYWESLWKRDKEEEEVQVSGEKVELTNNHQRPK